MVYHLAVYGNVGVIRNDAAEALYRGPLSLCRKALDSWRDVPLSPVEERELIDAQTRRVQQAWTRLLGGAS